MPPKVDKIKLTREHDRRAKLNDEQVKEVRAMHLNGYTQKAIAAKFCVCQSTICFIVNEHAHQNLLENLRRNRKKVRTTEQNTEYTRALRARKKILLKQMEIKEREYEGI